MGLILIIAPIMALLFGTDEPAMQTDQAALVLTGMIILGVIILANSRKKTSEPIPVSSYPTSSSQTGTITPASSVVHNASRFCPYCGAPVSNVDAKYCAKCGASLSST